MERQQQSDIDAIRQALAPLRKLCKDIAETAYGVAITNRRMADGKNRTNKEDPLCPAWLIVEERQRMECDKLRRQKEFLKVALELFCAFPWSHSHRTLLTEGEECVFEKLWPKGYGEAKNGDHLDDEWLQQCYAKFKEVFDDARSKFMEKKAA